MTASVSSNLPKGFEMVFCFVLSCFLTTVNEKMHVESTKETIYHQVNVSCHCVDFRQMIALVSNITLAEADVEIAQKVLTSPVPE